MKVMAKTSATATIYVVLGDFKILSSYIGWNRTSKIPRQQYAIKSENARSIYDLMNLNFRINFRQVCL